MVEEKNERGEESRFAHLLKPIRDLAENWNIDIAAELVEYLEALSDISIAFEDGETNLNFAEAALLIQGSTMVYSRKVEFLYNLVYKTLDLLCDDSNQAKPKKRGRREKATDSDLWKNERENFLLLDDVIPLSKTCLDLKVQSREEKAKLRESTLREPFPHALMAGRSELSSNALKLISCDTHTSGTVLLEKSDELRLAPREDDTSNTNIMPPPENRNDEESLPEEDFGGGGAEMDDYFDEDDMQSPAQMETSMGEDIQEHYNEEEEELVEWERLDPHLEDGTSKPFKKGKTWVLPGALLGDAKEGDQSEEMYLQPFVSMIEPCITAPRRTVIYPEFQRFYEQQRRNERRARIREMHLEKSSFQRMSTSREEPVEEDDEYDNEPANDFYYDDQDMDDDDQAQDLAPVQLDLESIAREGQPSRYVDLVRAHVDNFLKSADKWAVESNLHARVREWKERIEPFLEEQDTRPVFDIHDYGQSVLTGLAQIDANNEEPVSHGFSEVLNNLNPCEQETPETARFEVCRLFLASLQLANNGNVELQHDSNISDLKVRLLDTVLANKKLEGYLAPSAKEQENKSSNASKPSKASRKSRRKSKRAPVH